MNRPVTVSGGEVVALSASARAVIRTAPSPELPPVNQASDPRGMGSPQSPPHPDSALDVYSGSSRQSSHASGGLDRAHGSGVAAGGPSTPDTTLQEDTRAAAAAHHSDSDEARSISHESGAQRRRKAHRMSRKDLMPAVAQLAKMLPQSQLPHLTPFRLRELGVGRKTRHTNMNDVQDVVAARWAVASTVYGDAASEMLWSRLNKKYTQEGTSRGGRRTSGAASLASLASSVASGRSRSRKSHRDLHESKANSAANEQFDDRRFGVLPNMWDTVAPKLPPPQPAGAARVDLGLRLGSISSRSRRHNQHSTAPSQNEALRSVLSTKRVVPLVYPTNDPNVALRLKREQEVAERTAEDEAEALLERMLAEQATIEDTGYVSAIGEDELEHHELYIPVLEGENIGGAPTDSDTDEEHPADDAVDKLLKPWNESSSTLRFEDGVLDTSREEQAALDAAQVQPPCTGLGGISHARSASAAKRRKARRNKAKAKKRNKAHVGGLLVSPYGNVWLEDACLWPHSEDVLLPTEGGPTDRDRLIAKKRREEMKRQRLERARSIQQATRGRKYAEQHQPVLAAARRPQGPDATQAIMDQTRSRSALEGTSGHLLAPQLQGEGHWPPPSSELDQHGEPRERRFTDEENRVREIQFFDEAGGVCEVELYDDSGVLREHVFLDDEGELLGASLWDEAGRPIQEYTVPDDTAGDALSAPTHSLDAEKQDTVDLPTPSTVRAQAVAPPATVDATLQQTAPDAPEHLQAANVPKQVVSAVTQAPGSKPLYVSPVVAERRDLRLQRAVQAQRMSHRPPLLVQPDWEPSPAPSYMLHTVKERLGGNDALDDGEEEEAWSDSSSEDHRAGEQIGYQARTEAGADAEREDAADESAPAAQPASPTAPPLPTLQHGAIPEHAPVQAQAEETSELFGQQELAVQTGTDVQDGPARSMTDGQLDKPPLHSASSKPVPTASRPSTDMGNPLQCSLASPSLSKSSLGRRMRAASPRFLDVVDRVMTPRGRSLLNGGVESAQSLIPGGRTPLNGDGQDAFALSLEQPSFAQQPRDPLKVRLAHRTEDSAVTPLRQGRAPSAAGADIAKYQYSQQMLHTMPGLNESAALEAVLQSAPSDALAGGPGQLHDYDSDGTLSVVSAASSVDSVDARKHLETIEHSHAAITAETLAGVVGALQTVKEEDIAAFVSAKPTQDVIVVAAALCVLLGVKDPSWKRCRRVIKKPGFLDKLAIVAPTMLSKKARKAARTLLRQHSRHLHNLRVDKLTHGLMQAADSTVNNRVESATGLLGSVLHSWCVCMSWYNPSKAKAVPASGLGSMSGLQLDPDVLAAFASQGFERPEEAATAAAAAAALEFVNGKTLEQAMKKFGFYLSPELLDKFEHHFSALRAARRKRRQQKAAKAGAPGTKVEVHGPTLEEAAGSLSQEQAAEDRAAASSGGQAAGAASDNSSDSDLDEDTVSWQRAIFSAEAARKGRPPKLLAAREALLGIDYNAFSHLQHCDPTVQPVAVAAACLCIVFGRTPCWREAKALFADAKNTMHAIVSLQRREMPLRKRMLLACLLRTRGLMEMHPAKYFLTGVVLAVFFSWLRAYISTPTLPADKIFVPRSARLQGVEYGRSIAKQRQALGQIAKSQDCDSAGTPGGFTGKVSEAWENLNLDSVPPLLPPQLTGRMLHLLAAMGAKTGAGGDKIHVGVSVLTSQASLRAAVARARTRLSALDKLQSLSPGADQLGSMHPLNRARRGLLELDPVDILLFRKQEAPLALECAAVAGALCCVLGLKPDWNTVSQMLSDPQATRNLALLDPRESGHHDGHVQAQEVLHASHETLWPAVKYSRYKAALRFYRWLSAFLDEAMHRDSDSEGAE